jgi:hypothetical protein
MAEKLDRGTDQEQPENEEHERERRDQHGTQRDEDRAHDERREDPERQHSLLMLGGHRERGHDHHEHEQVVDGQALLDDVAREVLRAETPARDQSERGAEHDRHADVEERRNHRLAEPDRVRMTRPRHEEVDREEDHDQADRRAPAGQGHFEHNATLPDPRAGYAPPTGGVRSRAPARSARRQPRRRTRGCPPRRWRRPARVVCRAPRHETGQWSGRGRAGAASRPSRRSRRSSGAEPAHIRN